MDIYSILDHFDGVEKVGNYEWKCRCSCKRNHNNGDVKQSLSIAYDPQTDKKALHCHTGCSTEEVVKEAGLKMSDLMPDRPLDEETQLKNSIAWYENSNNLKFVAKYDYSYGKYQDGLAKIRFKKSDGDKTFRWIHRDPSSKSGFKWSHKGCPNRLYVRGDLNGSVQVNLTEGEKDADSTFSLTGITSVSTEDGATKGDVGKKWNSTYEDQLKGKDVYIFQDNDDAGKNFARIEAEKLYGHAKTVYLLDLVTVWPECPEKGDITDMIEALGADEAKKRLDKLIENATPFIPAAKSTTASDEMISPIQDDAEEPDLSQFHLYNDKGKANGVFDYEIHKYLKETQHIFILGKIPYIYQDGAYLADLSGAILKTMIRKLIYSQFVRSTTIKRIYDLFIDDADLQTTYERLNQYPPEWICFQNGFYDPVHKCMIDHDPKYKAINQIPYDYDPDADPEGETVKNWLDFITPEPDDREMLLQYAGYCLTRDTRQQKFMVLRGEGGTGKSTVINLIMQMIGPENITNISLAQLMQRFAAFNLMGKLLNSCADLEVTALEDVSTIKKIIGEDPISAEAKGKDPVNFRSYAKLIFSTNELPIVKTERTNGFYRRLLILKMDRLPEARSPDFYKQLSSEIDYFIHECVKAVCRMYENGFIVESEESKAEVQQLRCDSDTVEAFLAEKITVKKDGMIPRAKLYDSYTSYCQEMERQSLKKTSFFKAMRAKGFSERKANVNNQRGIDVFSGITFSENPAGNPADDFIDIDGVENPFNVLSNPLPLAGK